MHCQMVSFHQGLELSLRGEQLFAEGGGALFQNPKGLSCDSLTGVCQRLQTASLSVTDTSSITRSAGSCVHIMEQPAQQPGPAEEPLPVPGPTRSWPLSESFGIWARVTGPSEECAVCRIQRHTKHCAPVSVAGGARSVTFPSSWMEYPCMIHTTGFLHFTEAEGSHMFGWVHVPPPEAHACFQSPQWLPSHLPLTLLSASAEQDRWTAGMTVDN